MQYCISIPYTAPHSAERCLNGGSVVFSDGGRSDLSSAAGGRSAAAASVARRRTLRLPASLPTTFLRPRQSPSPGIGPTRRDRGRQPARRLRAEHQVRRQGPPTGQGRHRQGGTAGEERVVAAGRFSDRRPLVSCVHTSAPYMETRGAVVGRGSSGSQMGGQIRTICVCVIRADHDSMLNICPKWHLRSCR